MHSCEFLKISIIKYITRMKMNFLEKKKFLWAISEQMKIMSRHECVRSKFNKRSINLKLIAWPSTRYSFPWCFIISNRKLTADHESRKCIGGCDRRKKMRNVNLMSENKSYVIEDDWILRDTNFNRYLYLGSWRLMR